MSLPVASPTGRAWPHPHAATVTRWRSKADSNRRSLSVNELVSQAGMRMRARRQGWSRTRRPRSGDQGFESDSVRVIDAFVDTLSSLNSVVRRGRAGGDWADGL